MKTLINTNKYLSNDLVEQCFEKGKVHHVDKTMTGNGFTSSMLRINPKFGSVNVLIMPNKSGVMNKESAYRDALKDKDVHESKFGSNRIKFFYAEGMDKGFNDADVLVFVIDSYIHLAKNLNDVLVDKFVIDEYHTAEKDSSYRNVLKDILTKVKITLENQPDVCLTTITATPNLTSPITIEILNTLQKETIIQLASDEDRVIKEIRSRISNGDEVVVLSNSSEHLYHITYDKDKNATLPINYVAGKNFMTSAVQKANIKQDSKSKISFITSSGFESIDIDYKGAHVYYFEDFSNPYTSFSIQNLIQAISRPRAGAKTITYTRILSSKELKDNPPKDIEKFVNSEKIPTEAKMNSAYKAYRKYVIFEEAEDEFGATIKLNDVAIRMRQELNDWRLGNENLLQPEGEFKSYLEKRKVSFIKPDKKEAQKRRASSVSDKIKSVHLKNNDFIIRRDGLFDGGFENKAFDMLVEVKDKPDFDKQMRVVAKWFKRYRMCKDYDGQYKLTPREEIAYRLLTNGDEFKAFCKELVRRYSKMSKDKYGEVGSFESINTFKKNIVPMAIELVISLMWDRVKFYSNKVGNRDYNIAARLNMAVVEYTALYLGAYITEVDVVTCNPRILFALAGCSLPENFYGKNKVNKKKINILLNTLTFSSPNKNVKIYSKKDDPVGYKSWRYDKVKQLEKAGFPDAVIWWLEDNVFDGGSRGYFSYLMGYHEKRIISKLKKKILKGKQNDGTPRRHDSVLIFNNEEEIALINDINSFEYKGQTGFFDVCINRENANQVWSRYILELEAMDKRIGYTSDYVPQKPLILEIPTLGNTQYDLFG